MRTIEKIVVHHTAVDQKDMKKLLSSINKTHKKRFGRAKGYKGTEYIQYHFIIGVDGEVKKTAPLREILYHASNYRVNKKSIAICLSGNMDKHPPTAKQYGALMKLIREFNLSVHFHNEYANKTCPGIYTNKRFIEFMSERRNYFNNTGRLKIKKKRIKTFYEYKQTKNDCTRYAVMGGLSDTLDKGFTKAEFDNFKRWSNMFTDVGSGSNIITQSSILLNRWNFNHPERPVKAYITSKRRIDKNIGKLLARGYSIIYARQTGADFVKDKRDGIIERDIFDMSGWHATRAIFDRKTKSIVEINNYAGSKNNTFGYKDFLGFAKDYMRDYVIVFYEE